MKRKLVCGVTGMSLYSSEIQLMIENELKATPMYLCQNREDDLEWALNQCDFIVLSGGVDWSPTSTGGEMTYGQGLSKFDFLRDKRELFIMKWAKENSKNLLGICRGFQGIGLFHGLNLILDINGTEIVHNPSAADIRTDGNPVHFVHCLPQYCNDFFDKLLTNSWHHQSLLYSSDFDYSQIGIEVIGYAYLNRSQQKKKEQKIIEIMKTSDDLWMGTQFHIELDYEKNPASRIVLDKFKEIIYS